ncbi:unnamed protein product [Symbiodinium natans]|uniref:Uncharacterized protein n=1 Tax=Symbiodinium natans TaxID=878477 RepID=A0A812JRW3_9DINO|nr:unnamed protein product [Symbiodinium natans]
MSHAHGAQNSHDGGMDSSAAWATRTSKPSQGKPAAHLENLKLFLSLIDQHPKTLEEVVDSRRKTLERRSMAWLANMDHSSSISLCASAGDVSSDDLWRSMVQPRVGPAHVCQARVCKQRCISL